MCGLCNLALVYLSFHFRTLPSLPGTPCHSPSPSVPLVVAAPDFCLTPPSGTDEEPATAGLVRRAEGDNRARVCKARAGGSDII